VIRIAVGFDLIIKRMSSSLTPHSKHTCKGVFPISTNISNISANNY